MLLGTVLYMFSSYSVDKLGISLEVELLVHRGCAFNFTIIYNLLASTLAFEKLRAINILDAFDVKAFVGSLLSPVF